MSLEQLSITHYRSIRSLRVPLGRLTVVVGPNGSGKSNLYRAIRLAVAAAEGRLARTLLEEGGIPSVLWAGARQTLRKREPMRMVIEVTLEPVRYAIELGLPQPLDSAFRLDPEIKAENLWFAEDGQKPVLLAERKALSAWVRSEHGRETYAGSLDPAESMLSQLKDPHRLPILASLRTELAAWRFYHQFRTDLASPMRERRAGVRTPVLSADGSDLAAALQTIREIGFIEDLDAAISQAFPGAHLRVLHDEAAQFEVAMHMPGISRPLTARELSDGTLRYLCLLAALMSPRPPPFLVLNEPEISLHMDLMEPLGEQIARATRTSQVLVCTHSERLAQAIASYATTTLIELSTATGETTATVRQL